jgi:hypothetical protein
MQRNAMQRNHLQDTELSFTRQDEPDRLIGFVYESILLDDPDLMPEGSGFASRRVSDCGCTWRFIRCCIILNAFRANVSFQQRTAMPAAVKIKAGKYGRAIGLLLERGGAFQTRHERTLIVNAAQKKVLEEAGVVETNGMKERSGKEHGQQQDVD